MFFVGLVTAGTLVPGRWVAAQETVSFPTEDGGVVFAQEYAGGAHAVILAHGGRFTKESWADQAPEIAAAGFRVVAIDFRGRGQSRGGPQATAMEDVHYDVLAAVRYVRATGATTVSVVGASFGGWAATGAALAVPGAIDRLVLIASSGVDEPERIRGRKLFIIAAGDTTGSGAFRLPSIREQYERTTGPKALVILDGAAHAQFIFSTDQADRLLAEIMRFLTEP